MKDHKAQSKANEAARLARVGGTRSAYASGGAVKAYAAGGAAPPMAASPSPKPSLAKPGRMVKGAAKGKGKPPGGKGGTNVNVIIVPKDAAGGPKPDMGGPMPPPGAMPPGGPPMPPPGPSGPGGPPPPMMRKHGGRVESAKEERAEKRSDMAQDKAMMQKALTKHEKGMHKGAKLTKLRRGGRAK